MVLNLLITSLACVGVVLASIRAFGDEGRGTATFIEGTVRVGLPGCRGNGESHSGRGPRQGEGR